MSLYRTPLPAGWMVADRYRIENELVGAANSILYLAEDQELYRQVVVKEYFPFAIHRAKDGSMLEGAGWSRDELERGVQSFLEAARLHATLDHPGVVGVRDLVEQHDTGFLVMEKLEGPSLSELMLGGGAELEVAIWIGALVDALRTVHQQGIVHLEVGPENVLFDHGRPVLIDFGSAREIDERIDDASAFYEPYVAPEILESQFARATPAADIYSVAVITHELLARTLPRRRRISERIPRRWRTLLEMGLRPSPIMRGSDIIQWWSLLRST